MKKYNLKRSLTALGLAATMTVTLVGCGNSNSSKNNPSSYKTISTTEPNHGYCTSNYYLIYLGNNLYLAERKKITGDLAKDNLVDDDTAYDYYDVKTGKFLGRELTYTPIGYIGDKKYSVATCDGEFFEGKYGLGKIIPRCCIYSLDNFIKTTYFNQEEYDFLNSNNDDVRSFFKDNGFITYFADYCTGYKEYGVLTVHHIYNNHYQEAKLQKIICTDINGNKSIYFGYRCSYSRNDIGYNYIYDMISGRIIYIGQIKENSFLNVEISDFNNEENKTILELEQELQNDPNYIEVPKNDIKPEDVDYQSNMLNLLRVIMNLPSEVQNKELVSKFLIGVEFKRPELKELAQYIIDTSLTNNYSININKDDNVISITDNTSEDFMNLIDFNFKDEAISLSTIGNNNIVNKFITIDNITKTINLTYMFDETAINFNYSINDNILTNTLYENNKNNYKNYNVPEDLQLDVISLLLSSYKNDTKYIDIINYIEENLELKDNYENLSRIRTK